MRRSAHRQYSPFNHTYKRITFGTVHKTMTGVGTTYLLSLLGLPNRGLRGLRNHWRPEALFFPQTAERGRFHQLIGRIRDVTSRKEPRPRENSPQSRQSGTSGNSSVNREAELEPVRLPADTLAAPSTEAESNIRLLNPTPLSVFISVNNQSFYLPHLYIIRLIHLL